MRNWNLSATHLKPLVGRSRHYLWGIETFRILAKFSQSPPPDTTYEELKQKNDLTNFKIVKLQTLPMRNWNTAPEIILAWPTSSRHYLWGIETQCFKYSDKLYISPDTTYEELKLLVPHTWKVLSITPDTTYEELKQDFPNHYHVMYNRSRHYLWGIETTLHLRNYCIMYLAPDTTYEELKPFKDTVNTADNILQTLPMRNWNIWIYVLIYLLQLSRHYLWGIETTLYTWRIPLAILPPDTTYEELKLTIGVVQNFLEKTPDTTYEELKPLLFYFILAFNFSPDTTYEELKLNGKTRLQCRL